MIIYEQIFKKYGLSPTQQQILKLVGQNKTVLEIGSSAGYMTKFFLDNLCIIDIVEPNKQAIKKIPKRIRKIFNSSIEDGIYNLLNRDYEFIIMADVLEHLTDPQKVLTSLRRIASSNTKIIISLPNVASWVMRKQLFFKGDFTYQESGILDRTHLRFFTVNSLLNLLLQSGWKKMDLMGIVTRFPFEETIGKLPVLGWFFKKFLYQNLVEKYKNLSYYHFLVVATKDEN